MKAHEVARHNGGEDPETDEYVAEEGHGLTQVRSAQSGEHHRIRQGSKSG